MVPDIGMVLTAVAALAAVLGLIMLVGWMVRRGGWVPRPTAGRVLAAQETIALDARRRLHLVRCGDRHALLLTGGSQDVVVGWLDLPPGADPGP
jgi:flagellar protein FliO/FliZ